MKSVLFALLFLPFDASGYSDMTITSFKKTETGHTAFRVNSIMLNDSIICGYNVNGEWLKNSHGQRILDIIPPGGSKGPYYMRKEYSHSSLSVICDFAGKSKKVFLTEYKG